MELNTPNCNVPLHKSLPNYSIQDKEKRVNKIPPLKYF